MIDIETIPFKQSPNFHPNRGGRNIEFIIVHAMIGTMEGTKSWFLNPESAVSSHYLVGLDGILFQMVKDGDTAFHCFGVNQRSIGIEHEDKGQSPTNPNWCSETLLDSSAQLVAGLLKKHNLSIDSVIGHDAPWIQQLSIKYRHYDPGKFWPWSSYKQLINHYLSIEN